MNNTAPIPAHGLKQTTEKGNILICVITEGDKKKFFYMSPAGKYFVHEFTKKKDGKLLTTTEWNFLFEKTQKVEEATKEELRMAETLIPCIMEDPFYAWTIEEAVVRNQEIVKYTAENNGSCMANIPGFDKLFNKVPTAVS
jgi:hypothetical protein